MTNTTGAGLLAMLDRPVAFHRCLVGVGGGVTGALMLSQALYWSRRAAERNGWFWKTREEWQEETGLSRWEQETARKALVAAGVLEEKRVGLPARLHYRVDTDRLAELLGDSNKSAGKPPTGGRENRQQVGQSTAGIKGTETTSETTSGRSTPPKPSPTASRPAEPTQPIPDADRVPTEQLRRLEQALGRFLGSSEAVVAREGWQLAARSEEAFAAGVERGLTFFREQHGARAFPGSARWFIGFWRRAGAEAQAAAREAEAMKPRGLTLEELRRSLPEAYDSRRKGATTEEHLAAARRAYEEATAAGEKRAAAAQARAIRFLERQIAARQAAAGGA